MRKRRGYFFAAFISAAITFGLLTAFVNPKYSGMQYGYGYGHHWGWRHRGYYPPYPYYNYPPPANWQDISHNAPHDWHQQQ